MFAINIIILLTIFTVCLGLAVIVLLRAKGNIANWTFTIFILGVAGWNLSIALFQLTSNVWWGKLPFTFSCIIIASFWLFSKCFPKARIKKNELVVVLPWLAFLIISLFFTNFLYTRFSIDGYITGELGILYPIFGLFFIAYFVWAFVNLFLKFRKSKGLARLQIGYVLWGSLLFGIGGVTTNLILPSFGIYNFNTLGPAFAVILVVFTSYAILKHRLFHIRVIVTELLVSGILLVLFIQTILFKSLVELVWRSIFLIVVSILGWLLIKGMLQEIERRKKIQKLNRKLKDFVAITSHQLMGPLGVIKNYLWMLAGGEFGEITSKQKEIVGFSFENTERLIRTIDTFLNVSKIEKGKLELRKRKIKIENLINSAIKQLSNIAKRKKLKLKFEVPKKPLPEVFADPDKIMDVLLNLIENAIKYTEKGEVFASVETTENKITVHIKDTGIGIPKSLAPRLFEEYCRGKEAIIQANGTGLGLYIVKMIVEAHGGKVWVKSEGKGKGSTFSFSLPIKK
ncbi:hypothetical protein KAW65_00320 [candidate division WOR-3 bacterium]|nr:hypothetical protein [candidate division WOR-3 bacterium]